MNVPDGTTATFAAGDAGSVTIRRTGSTLSIVSVNGNPGWSSEVEQGTGPEIEVKFVNGATRVDFNAELEDGGVRVRVSSADSSASDDNSGPGKATDEQLRLGQLRLGQLRLGQLRRPATPATTAVTRATARAATPATADPDAHRQR